MEASEVWALGVPRGWEPGRKGGGVQSQREVKVVDDMGLQGRNIKVGLEGGPEV